MCFWRDRWDLQNWREDTDIKHIVDTNAPPFIRQRDKWSFTLGVINMVFLAYFTGGYHGWMPLVYTVKAPLLLLTRAIYFIRNKWGYFLLDFCYFANGLLLVYLWAVPHDERVFAMVFAVCNGPLLFAVALFRNSLVFHSLDKITSLFIHLSPSLVTFCIRWFSTVPGTGGAPVADTGATSLGRFRVCPVQALESVHADDGGALLNGGDRPACGSLAWQLGAPLAFYVAWGAVYLLCITFVWPLPKDETYLTSYRWLTRRGPLRVLRNMTGGWVVYCLINTAVTAVMMAATLLMNRWYEVHFACIFVFMTISIYNGGSFYIEVFSRKYKGVEHTPKAKKK